jgi:hypothetical protein
MIGWKQTFCIEPGAQLTAQYWEWSAVTQRTVFCV